ncbi:hypothetical protein GN244_ATG18324 [Phytophthora infestans]|uniref:Uncharacterized protein n=1 Tax=Phytophthora infestans TaxID=4787 RepID=A0A833WDT4_PHYIN|nr:hypothetical protein GN244_ATG18324 [Phytophthora infestans]
MKDVTLTDGVYHTTCVCHTTFAGLFVQNGRVRGIRRTLGDASLSVLKRAWELRRFFHFPQCTLIPANLKIPPIFCQTVKLTATRSGATEISAATAPSTQQNPATAQPVTAQPVCRWKLQQMDNLPARICQPRHLRGATTNPFKSALHKFAQKKKERVAAANLSNAATSGFFSRGNSKTAAQMEIVFTLGLVCQLRIARLKTSRSLDAHRRSRHSLHEDELEQAGHGAHGNSHSHSHTVGDKGSPHATPLVSASSSRNASGNLRYMQFEQLLDKEVVDLDQLRKLSWVASLRTIGQQCGDCCWYVASDVVYLLNFSLVCVRIEVVEERRAAMLERKRQEYELLQQYYYIPDTDRGMREQTTLRQILVDIPRTNADVKLFQNERIHQVRSSIVVKMLAAGCSVQGNPASGYIDILLFVLPQWRLIIVFADTDNPQMCDLTDVSDET